MTFDPSAGPFGSVPDHLKANTPGVMPASQEVGDAMARLSPFTEAQDVDAIIKGLILDRPLKLYIPHKERYPDWEFRIINSLPGEIADAHNKGFKEVTDPDTAELFNDLVAGTDKNGKAFRPILCARPKAVGAHIRKRNRMQLASLYAGMDPSNKELDGKYTEAVGSKDGTKGSFSGPTFKIRT